MNTARLGTNSGFLFAGPVSRAAVLVPVALALWWFLLKPPSLWLLRHLAYVPLALLLAPAGQDPVRLDPNTGEWMFNVAVNTYASNPQTGEGKRIDSLEFAASEDNLVFFAGGWFSYLALAYSAVGFSRIQVKRVLGGLGVQTGINILALAAYAYINAYGAAINMPGSSDARLWLIQYSYHIIYLVVPFAAPFAVAVMIHPEWRQALGMFSGGPAGKRT